MEKKNGGENRKKEKNYENCDHYIIASSGQPERRPLERRTCVPIFEFLNMIGRYVARLGLKYYLPTHALAFLFWESYTLYIRLIGGYVLGIT